MARITKRTAEVRFRSEATGAPLLDAPDGRDDPDDYFFVSLLDLSVLFERIDRLRFQLKDAGGEDAWPPRDLRLMEAAVEDAAARRKEYAARKPRSN